MKIIKYQEVIIYVYDTSEEYMKDNKKIDTKGRDYIRYQFNMVDMFEKKICDVLSDLSLFIGHKDKQENVIYCIIFLKTHELYVEINPLVSEQAQKINQYLKSQFDYINLSCINVNEENINSFSLYTKPKNIQGNSKINSTSYTISYKPFKLTINIEEDTIFNDYFFETQGREHKFIHGFSPKNRKKLLIQVIISHFLKKISRHSNAKTTFEKIKNLIVNLTKDSDEFAIFVIYKSEFIVHVDGYNKNILEQAIIAGNGDMVELILYYFHPLISRTNSKMLAVTFLSGIFWSLSNLLNSDGEIIPILNIIFDFFKLTNEIYPELLKDIVENKTNDVFNFISTLVSIDANETISLVLDFFNKNKVLSVIFTNTDEKGRTLLHIVCQSGKLNLIHLILDYAKKVSSKNKENKFKKFFIKIDSEGNTAMHYCCMYANEDSVVLMLEQLKTICHKNIEEYKQFFLTTNKKNENIIAAADKNKSYRDAVLNKINTEIRLNFIPIEVEIYFRPLHRLNSNISEQKKLIVTGIVADEVIDNYGVELAKKILNNLTQCEQIIMSFYEELKHQTIIKDNSIAFSLILQRAFYYFCQLTNFDFESHEVAIKSLILFECDNQCLFLIKENGVIKYLIDLNGMPLLSMICQTKNSVLLKCFLSECKKILGQDFSLFMLIYLKYNPGFVHKLIYQGYVGLVNILLTHGLKEHSDISHPYTIFHNRRLAKNKFSLNGMLYFVLQDFCDFHHADIDVLFFKHDKSGVNNFHLLCMNQQLNTIKLLLLDRYKRKNYQDIKQYILDTRKLIVIPDCHGNTSMMLALTTMNHEFIRFILELTVLMFDNQKNLLVDYLSSTNRDGDSLISILINTKKLDLIKPFLNILEFIFSSVKKLKTLITLLKNCLNSLNTKADEQLYSYLERFIQEISIKSLMSLENNNLNIVHLNIEREFQKLVFFNQNAQLKADEEDLMIEVEKNNNDENELGKILNAFNNYGYTKFHELVKNNEIEKIKTIINLIKSHKMHRLLENCLSTKCKYNNYLPLDTAIELGQLKIFFLLADTIASDIKVDITQSIYIAVKENQYDVIYKLVELNRNLLSHKNKIGQTPFLYACSIGHEQCALNLLKLENNIAKVISNRDVNENNVLHLIAKNNMRSLVDNLNKNISADIFLRKNKKGFFPIEIAATKGHYVIMEIYYLKMMEYDKSAINYLLFKDNNIESSVFYRALDQNNYFLLKNIFGLIKDEISVIDNDYIIQSIQHYLAKTNVDKLNRDILMHLFNNYNKNERKDEHLKTINRFIEEKKIVYLSESYKIITLFLNSITNVDASIKKDI